MMSKLPKIMLSAPSKNYPNLLRYQANMSHLPRFKHILLITKSEFKIGFNKINLLKLDKKSYLLKFLKFYIEKVNFMSASSY